MSAARETAQLAGVLLASLLRATWASYPDEDDATALWWGGRLEQPDPGGGAMDEPVGSAATALEVTGRTSHAHGPAVTETITMHTVGRVCTLVRAAAGRAGVATSDLDDLLIAVSELITNVIRHAGGTGSITVRSMSAGLFAEISDNGPGLPEDMTIGRPPPGVRQGQGLWLARLLCDDLQVVSGNDGVTVRIFTPRRAPI